MLFSLLINLSNILDSNCLVYKMSQIQIYKKQRNFDKPEQMWMFGIFAW